jgi:sulfatase maturation enzyme AslB (radical SAM superfamily)
MINAKGFKTHDELENSEWLRSIRDLMDKDMWPAECVRCYQSEKSKGESIRTNSIDRHKILRSIKDDYLIVGGVLDNTCNSACQTCNAGLSTKIGSLHSKNYPKTDNYEAFRRLPSDRIVELDVNGGEPTASRNYKKILNDLPPNVKIVRMNTNGSRMIGEIEKLLKKQISVIVTMSLDGIGTVHDYVRWPIKWNDYQNTVDNYKSLQNKYKLLQLDFWTTVSCLNVNDLPNIVEFAKSKNIPHDWAFLHQPNVLNVRNRNVFTQSARHMFPNEVAVDRDNSKQLYEFIHTQDTLRNIRIENYLNFA